MTYEEVKAIRKNPTAEACDIKELQRLIDIAINKQIPKPPKFAGGRYVCRCGWDIYRDKQPYCLMCGQAMDWEGI
jgi:hypothetical protein